MSEMISAKIIWDYQQCLVEHRNQAEKIRANELKSQEYKFYNDAPDFDGLTIHKSDRTQNLRREEEQEITTMWEDYEPQGKKGPIDHEDFLNNPTYFHASEEREDMDVPGSLYKNGRYLPANAVYYTVHRHLDRTKRP